MKFAKKNRRIKSKESRQDFRFIIYDRNKISIAIYELELNNKSRIIVIGYNEMADFCYRKLQQNDEVTQQDYINSEIRVILEDIRKNK